MVSCADLAWLTTDQSFGCTESNRRGLGWAREVKEMGRRCQILALIFEGRVISVGMTESEESKMVLMFWD